MISYKPYRQWLRFAVFNLTLLAVAGALLRYKIAFSLPWVDQKSLLHAHSHFAFAGWLTQVIMILMVYTVERMTVKSLLSRYRWPLLANGITAYGMLFSFPFGGYTSTAIVFSTLSLFANWWFAGFMWKDTALWPAPLVFQWFRASIVWMVISAAGPFALAYQMANHLTDVKGHLVAEYYFLHFQYNGWFLFAAMGLLFSFLSPGNDEKKKRIFHLFLFSCIPAYFLSVLWLKIPVWFYWIVVLAALMQFAGWLQLVRLIRSSVFEKVTARNLWLLAAIAFTIKLVLQAGSTIPELSHFAFGYRPVVIGYLHLIFLGVFTFFLLGAAFANSMMEVNKTGIAGLWIFAGGVILNEVFLFIQGMTAVAGTYVETIQVWLFAAAVCMLAGLILLVAGIQIKNKEKISLP